MANNNMSGPSIYELFSTTPWDHIRNSQAKEAGLQKTIADTDYQRALADRQRFETEQGRAKLPYELTELSQKTDKDLFASGKSKSMAENQQATQKALQSIANATKEDLMKTFLDPLMYNDAIFTNAIQQLNSGASLQEVTQRTMSFMTKSGLKIGPELLRQMESMANSGMSPREAAQQLSQAQVANKEAMERANPETIRKLLFAQAEASFKVNNDPMKFDEGVWATIVDFCAKSPNPQECMLKEANRHKAASVVTSSANEFSAARDPVTNKPVIRDTTNKGVAGAQVGQGTGGAAVSNAPAKPLSNQVSPEVQRALDELARRGVQPPN
jgi:hypothetical protein